MKRFALTALALSTVTLTGCSTSNEVVNKAFSPKYPVKQIIANANQKENKPLEPKQVANVPTVKEEKKEYIREVEVLVTYYSLDDCDKSRRDPAYGITASGTKAKVGRTIAMRGLPFGSVVMIDNHLYTVEDVGGKIYGNHIDMLVSSKKEAIQKGRQHKKAYIISYGDGKKHFN